MACCLQFFFFFASDILTTWLQKTQHCQALCMCSVSGWAVLFFTPFFQLYLGPSSMSLPRLHFFPITQSNVLLYIFGYQIKMLLPQKGFWKLPYSRRCCSSFCSQSQLVLPSYGSKYSLKVYALCLTSYLRSALQPSDYKVQEGRQCLFSSPLYL